MASEILIVDDEADIRDLVAVSCRTKAMSRAPRVTAMTR